MSVARTCRVEIGNIFVTVPRNLVSPDSLAALAIGHGQHIETLHSHAEQDAVIKMKAQASCQKVPWINVVVDYANGIELNTVGGCNRHLNAAIS